MLLLYKFELYHNVSCKPYESRKAFSLEGLLIYIVNSSESLQRVSSVLFLFSALKPHLKNAKQTKHNNTSHVHLAELIWSKTIKPNHMVSAGVTQNLWKALLKQMDASGILATIFKRPTIFRNMMSLRELWVSYKTGLSLTESIYSIIFLTFRVGLWDIRDVLSRTKIISL